MYNKKKREYQAAINGALKKEAIMIKSSYFTFGENSNYFTTFEGQLKFAGRQWREESLEQAHQKHEDKRQEKFNQKLLGYNLIKSGTL